MIKWYKLYFKTPVHIGERGVGVEKVNKFIPSTTFWSALIYSMIQLEILDPNTDLKCLFRVNTPTPIINDEAMFWINTLDIILYEKITSLLNNSRFNDPLNVFDEANNILKNTVLATIELLKYDLSKCSLIAEENGVEAENIELKLQCDGKEYYFNKLEGVGYAITSNKFGYKKILEIEKRPRNIIDRVTGSATPYHLSVTRYNTPLLLGIEILDNKLSVKDIEASLRLLGDIGVGGERTYGFGKFTFEYFSPELYVNKSGDYVVVQGLYYPGINMLSKILNGNTLYNMKIHGYRSGFSGMLRGPVFVLTEGSFVSAEEYIDGIIVVDQRYGERVARSFDPITFKIKI